MTRFSAFVFCVTVAACPLVSSAGPEPLRIEVGTQGNELAFDKTTLRAKANQPIELRFVNRADPSSGLEHNWVLTKPGKDQEIAAKGVEAGAAKNYVPSSPDVIVSSKLVKPGQSQTLSFRAPSVPGDYPFVCTFPGHSSLLKGKLTVEK